MAKSPITPAASAWLTPRLLFWLLVIFGFFGFIALIDDILLPFVLGILIAYFLDPAADKLESWNLSRGLSASTIILIFFSLVVVVILALAPTLIKQVAGLLADIPHYINRLQTIIMEQMGRLPIPIDIQERFDTESLIGSFVGSGKGIATGLLQSGMAFINIVSLLVITPVVAFYLLRDWDKLVARIDELLPRKHADTIRTQLNKIDETLAGFIRGQFNVMLILGAFYAIALLLAGLKYAVIIGLLCGFLIIVPYIGAFIGGVLSTGIALVQFDDWKQVAIVAGIFVVGQMLEGYALTPKLVGDRVGLHPVWVIFGMLAGASLFGFVGILIAVPVTAIIGVLVRFAIEQYEHSSFYEGN